MKQFGICTVVSLFLLLCGGHLQASVILIWDPQSSPDVHEYQRLLEGLEHPTVITDDLVGYVNEYGLEDVDAIFSIFAYDLLQFPENEAQILMDFMDKGGGVYIEGRYFYHERLNNDYLHVAWTTCDPWLFKTFRGVDKTFMSGLRYSFPDSIWSSTMEPDYIGAEVVLEDEVMCGCVTSATTDPNIRAVVSSQPVMRILEGDPWSTKEEMLRRITKWLAGFLDTDQQETPKSLPQTISLQGNFPNPFNSSTSVRVRVNSDRALALSLKIYNLAGRLVKTLKDGQILPGDYHFTWEGKDDSGRDVSSGIYFCKLSSPECQSCLTMSLLR